MPHTRITECLELYDTNRAQLNNQQDQQWIPTQEWATISHAKSERNIDSLIDPYHQDLQYYIEK